MSGGLKPDRANARSWQSCFMEFPYRKLAVPGRDAMFLTIQPQMNTDKDAYLCSSAAEIIRLLTFQFGGTCIRRLRTFRVATRVARCGDQAPVGGAQASIAAGPGIGTRRQAFRLGVISLR